MSDLSPALLEELAVNLRVADPEPFDGLDDRAYYRKFAGSLAPILSRALAEAWAQGQAAKPCLADIEVGGQQGVMRSTPSNPYLTEKEH